MKTNLLSIKSLKREVSELKHDTGICAETHDLFDIREKVLDMQCRYINNNLVFSGPKKVWRKTKEFLKTNHLRVPENKQID